MLMACRLTGLVVRHAARRACGVPFLFYYIKAQQARSPATIRVFVDGATEPQQTVDGGHAALEITARSTYVPSTPFTMAARRWTSDARPHAARPTRLELPVMDEILKAKRQQAAAGRAIAIRGAREHNLKNIDVEI